MTVLDIVEQYLKDNGYDGLCDDDECGCVLGDLAPCCSYFSECMPAYNHGPSEDYDHTLHLEPPVTDDQLDLLRHALGLFDGPAGEGRNHLAANAENDAEVKDWQQLVRWRLARRVYVDGELLHYQVTDKGKALVKP